MAIQERLQQYLTGVSVSDVEGLANGWETEVYGFTASGGAFAEGRALVLRLYNGDLARIAPRVTGEGHAMRRLRAAGYAVPEVFTLELDPAHVGGPFLIMERVAGGPLWKRVQGAALAGELAALMFRLHQQDAELFLGDGGPWQRPADGLNTFSLPVLRELLDSAGLGEAAEPVVSRLEALEPGVRRAPRGLIHGDFHPDNVLTDAEGSPYVIDWSSAVLDDPRVDVAQTVVLAMTNDNPEGAVAFREAYEKLYGGPLPHFDYFVLLALFRRLATALITMVAGSAVLGLRPGLEEQLWRDREKVRQFVGVLEEMAGVALPGLYQALEQRD